MALFRELFGESQSSRPGSPVYFPTFGGFGGYGGYSGVTPSYVPRYSTPPPDESSHSSAVSYCPYQTVGIYNPQATSTSQTVAVVNQQALTTVPVQSAFTYSPPGPYHTFLVTNPQYYIHEAITRRFGRLHENEKGKVKTIPFEFTAFEQHCILATARIANKSQNSQGSLLAQQKTALKSWLSDVTLLPLVINVDMCGERNIDLIQYPRLLSAAKSGGVDLLSFEYGDVHVSGCTVKLDGRSKEFFLPDKLLQAIECAKENNVDLLWCDFFNDACIESEVKKSRGASSWSQYLIDVYRNRKIFIPAAHRGSLNYSTRAWVFQEMVSAGEHAVDLEYASAEYFLMRAYTEWPEVDSTDMLSVVAAQTILTACTCGVSQPEDLIGAMFSIRPAGVSPRHVDAINFGEWVTKNCWGRLPEDIFERAKKEIPFIQDQDYLEKAFNAALTALAISQVLAWGGERADSVRKFLSIEIAQDVLSSLKDYHDDYVCHDDYV